MVHWNPHHNWVVYESPANPETTVLGPKISLLDWGAAPGNKDQWRSRTLMSRGLSWHRYPNHHRNWEWGLRHRSWHSYIRWINSICLVFNLKTTSSFLKKQSSQTVHGLGIFESKLLMISPGSTGICKRGSWKERQMVRLFRMIHDTVDQGNPAPPGVYRLPISWCRISAINSRDHIGIMKIVLFRNNYRLLKGSDQKMQKK